LTVLEAVVVDLQIELGPVPFGVDTSISLKSFLSTIS